MANINTFSENMSQLTKSVNDAITMIQGYGSASTSLDSSVQVTLSDGSKISIPSQQNMAKRLERVENTVDAFVTGNGVVETNDGTSRIVKVQTVAQAPESIQLSDVSVTSFDIDTNWFFEDLMFPKCTINLDLKDKIDSRSDRIRVARFILTYGGTSGLTYQTYIDEIYGKDLSYSAMVALLNKHRDNGDFSYSLDTETLDLPLSYEKYSGDFEIIKIVTEQATGDSQRLWYYLDTIQYQSVDENGEQISNAYRLSLGDKLRYKDSLYEIVNIDQSAKKVALEFRMGADRPSSGKTFSIYNSPFSSKVASIPVGFNEINIIYLKGVNEDYNIVSKDWSNPICFITNDLKYGDSNTTLAEYYTKYVLDFGSEMIAKAKEGRVYAYDGLTPNAPVINKDNLKVVQINTQLEATLETETYNNLVSSIYSTKSTISDLKKTIAANKEKLITTSDSTTRSSIQSKISDDNNSLSGYTTQYNSLVEELNTLLKNNGAIGYEPKYHVRGFFPIPKPRYSDEPTNTLGKQEVIGFDIMYRYIHTDDTGVTLDTFTYTDGSNTSEVINAVFSDWNMIQSKMKEQVYDDLEGVYVWESESVADGNTININQIDIPIRSGEKVQIKVRSISEAGYPTNPIKSDWSEIVTISFPSNLTSENATTKVIDSAKNDMTAVVLQQTMSSAGLYTHLADSNDTYKHNADNISATMTQTVDNKTSIETVTVQEYLRALDGRIAKLESAQS